MNDVRVRIAVPARRHRSRHVTLRQQWAFIKYLPEVRRIHWRFAVNVLMFSAAYAIVTCVTADLSARYSLTGTPTLGPLYFPIAIVVSALLFTPPVRWWVLVLAAPPVQLWFAVQPGRTPTLVLLEWATDILLAISVAWMMRRFSAIRPRFLAIRAAGGRPIDQTIGVKDVGVFILCVSSGAIPAASFAAALRHLILGQAYWPTFENWYLGRVLAIAVFVPIIVLQLAATPLRWRTRSNRRMVEALVLTITLALVCAFVFGSSLPGFPKGAASLYLLVPVLLWAAVRFGIEGSASALAVVSLWAVVGTALMAGPFAEEPGLNAVLAVQLFLAAIGVPVLGLGALEQEREDAQSSMEQSEERYRDLVETQTDMICRYLPDSTLIFVNAAYCRYYGRTHEELIRSKFVEMLDEKARQRYANFTATLLASSESATISEHEVRRPDGSVRWQQWIDHPIRDSSGNVVEFLAIGRDITGRKQDEEALRASEARFRTAFESAGVGMAIVDISGHILEVNRPMVEMLGYSTEELRALTFAQITYKDDVNKNLELFERAVRGETQGYQMEKRYVHKQGHVIWGRLSAGVVRGSGNTVHLVSQLEDITERKRAEDERERLTRRLLSVQDEERRSLARDLHDGTAQTIAALSLNLTTLRAVARGAIRNKARFQRMLADSQALAEQAMRETRTLSYLLHPPQLDMAGLVPALSWYVKGFNQRSGITVDLQAAPTMGRLPAETERALFRIVQECLANVYRHSGSSTARVVLARRKQSVRLIVIDHGRGLPAASQSKDVEPENAMTLGVGIPGMRQRLRQLGGGCVYDPVPEGR